MSQALSQDILRWQALWGYTGEKIALTAFSICQVRLIATISVKDFNCTQQKPLLSLKQKINVSQFTDCGRLQKQAQKLHDIGGGHRKCCCRTRPMKTWLLPPPSTSCYNWHHLFHQHKTTDGASSLNALVLLAPQTNLTMESLVQEILHLAHYTPTFPLRDSQCTIYTNKRVIC